MTLRASTTQPIRLSVATQTDLRAADASYLLGGDIAHVRSENLYYQYEPDSTATPSDMVLVTANSAAGVLAGRWVLMAGMGGFTTQSIWFIDADTGNDENDGATALTALATWAEFTRRVQVIGANTTVNILSDLAEPISGSFRGVFDPLTSSIPVLTVVGDPTAAVTGTILATANPDSATNAEGTLTSAAVPDWTAHIGRIVETTSGAAIRSWAPVLDDAAGTAQIPFWVQASSLGITSLTLPLAGVDIRVLVLNTVESVSLIGLGEIGFVVRYLRITPGASFVGATTFATQFEACQFASSVFQLGYSPVLIVGCSLLSGSNFDASTAGMSFVGGAIGNSVAAAPMTVRKGNVSFNGTISYSLITIGDNLGNANVVVESGAGAGSRGGFGVFLSATSGIIVGFNGSLVIREGVQCLYGDGNTAFGLNVIDGGRVRVEHPDTVPSITGAGQEIALDSQPTCVLPLTAGDLAVPAAEALATWANWRGDAGANWRRVAVNYAFTAAATGQASGSSIIGDR